jgi:hypothetical protein
MALLLASPGAAIGPVRGAFTEYKARRAAVALHRRLGDELAAWAKRPTFDPFGYLDFPHLLVQAAHEAPTLRTRLPRLGY